MIFYFGGWSYVLLFFFFLHRPHSLPTPKTCHCFSLGSNEAEWKGRGTTGGALSILTVIFGKETEWAPSTGFRKVLRFQRDNSSLKCPANSSDWYKRALCRSENNEIPSWMVQNGGCEITSRVSTVFFILGDIREHSLQTQHTQCMWMK